MSRKPDAPHKFLIAVRQEQIIGCIGLETYPPVGLLRSLCVENAVRSHGLVHQLCESLPEDAERMGIRDFYLLTTTATCMVKYLSA